MKAVFVPKLNLSTSSMQVSVGLLALRLLVGVAFILHGSGKIGAATSWMGPDSPVPGIFQALAALAEFGGGFALILGLLTPLVSLGMIFTMFGAIAFHIQKGDGFVGGYELAFLYLVSISLILLTGPGRISADAVIAKSFGNIKN